MSPEIRRGRKEQDKSIHIQVDNLGSFGFMLEERSDGYEFHFRSRSGVNHLIETFSPYVAPQRLGEREKNERLKVISGLFRDRGGWLHDDLSIKFDSSELIGVTTLGTRDLNVINYGLRFANQDVVASAYFALLPEADLYYNDFERRLKILRGMLEKSGVLDERSLNELKTLVPQPPSPWGDNKAPKRWDTSPKAMVERIQEGLKETSRR